MSRNRSLAMESLECRRLLAFNPTAGEQELLQLVNRFRTDPQGEFGRLMLSASPLVARDPVLQVDLNYAQVSGPTLQSQWQGMQPVPPVAWNAAISGFTAGHNARMISSSPPQQFHSDTLTRRQALLDAGVNLRFRQGEKINSENVFGYGRSPLHTFAAFVVDWQAGGPGGMRPDLGHRMAISNPDYEQLGQTTTLVAGGNFGPQVTTQVLANIENPPVMVVGAVFEDKNNSRWYEAGEGIGQAKIVFEGAAGTFSTTALSAGGYQIELPAGTYQITASGGGMKHAIQAGGITVAATNVWKNLIYDPSAAPPPDRLEPNNSLAAATPLSGGAQTLSGLSIHHASDSDYFRFTAQGTGNANFAIQFTHAAGNLDLRLLDASGNQITASSSSGNQESVSAAVRRGSTYYLHVHGVGGAVNHAYTLNVDPPLPARPVAVEDRAMLVSGSPTLSLDLLANDSDADSDMSQMQVRLAAASPVAFQLSGNRLNYTPAAGFSGVQRTHYTLVDDQNLESAVASIEIFVIDFAASLPWQNARQKRDVNDDGLTSPLDALLITNELNARNSRRLPTASSPEAAQMFGFLDTSGDGFLSALDVLLVINSLNAGGNGEGEGQAFDQAQERTAAPHQAETHDRALVQLMAAFADAPERRKLWR